VPEQTDKEQRLLIYNTGIQVAQAQVELLTSEQGGILLDKNGLVKHHLTASGTLMIDVKQFSADQDRPMYLRSRGAVQQATFVSDEGRILRGKDIAITSGGRLWLEHTPGWLMAWLDASDSFGKSLFETKQLAQSRALMLPNKIVLEAAPATYSIDVKQAVSLSLLFDGPLAVRLQNAAGNESIEFFESSRQCALLLLPGKNVLQLRPMSISGNALSVALLSEEITSIGDGLGAESLLMGGQSSMYTFTLGDKATIGFGAKADSDLVYCRLLDSHGHELATGIIGSAELPAGQYYLQIVLPAAAAPVKLRPALVGLKKPDLGPPLEIIKQYVQANAPQTLPSNIEADYSEPEDYAY